MIDFVQALKDKYVYQEDVQDETYIPNDDKITTQITLVGFGKVASVQKQLRLLTNIDLSKRTIVNAGIIASLENALAGVKILNLANNHIDWCQLILIVKTLPQLKELIVTSNNLETLTHSQLDYPKEKCGTLTSLVIGKTPHRWEVLISYISNIWTRVSGLDLWNCDLSGPEMHLTQPDNDEQTFLNGIETLRLSSNRFNDPSWIIPTRMHHIIDLDLSKCRLESFFMNDELADRLKHLQMLNISYNNLNDWTDISSLYKLKQLKSLVCHENPFFILEKLSKPFIIARIGTISNINREDITNRNRRDSEILYIRQIFPEYKAYTQGLNSDFNTKHPRFYELSEIYGLPEDPNVKQEVSKYLNLEMFFNGCEIRKKVPRDMRISNLRMLIKRLFKISPSSHVRMTCSGTTSSGEDLSYELEGDSQTLHFYSVHDNQKLIIEILDS